MIPRIFLVEDEENIRDAIKLNLEMEGYEVVISVDGLDAIQKFNEQHFNLIILDVMLPHVDGFEICEQIRLKNTKVPILFLTAKNNSIDRINGLKRGADDYITKPFSLEEFLLRVKILVKHSLRGTQEESTFSEYAFNGNKINFSNHIVQMKNGEEIPLTKKEAMLLKLLIERKNEVVTRQQILHSVWGYDVYPSTRTIDNFILAFRKYFEKDPKNPRYFHSIRGVGYKFTD